MKPHWVTEVGGWCCSEDENEVMQHVLDNGGDPYRDVWPQCRHCGECDVPLHECG